MILSLKIVGKRKRQQSKRHRRRKGHKPKPKGFGDMGIPTMGDYISNQGGYGAMSMMPKSKKKSRSNSIYESDWNTGNSTLRRPTQKERRAIKKKYPKGRIIGVDNNMNPMISMDMGSGMRSGSGMGSIGIPTPSDMNFSTKSSRRSGRKSYTNKKINSNLNDTGFGFSQKDLDPDREISKKGLRQTRLKTPFGDRVSTEIPVSDEEGNPLKNERGGQVKETVTTYENVSPPVQAISGGLRKVSQKIKEKYEEDKKKRFERDLADKAFQAELRKRGARANRDDRDQYCISISDPENTGKGRTVCYGTREEAENAMDRARSEGLTAIKI